MVRARFLLSLLAAVVVLAASAAHAADYPQPPPPPPQYIPPPPRGMLRQLVSARLRRRRHERQYRLDYIQNPANSASFAFDSNVDQRHHVHRRRRRLRVNNWLRLEATAEYRAKARVYAFGHYTDGAGFDLDTYEGNLKSWVFLANAFIDLGTWDCLTPFVGAGVGGAYNTLADFTDVNPSTAGFGFGRNPSEWNLAWALYAGVSYNVTKNFKIDLTYRYLNYGSITDTVDCIGGCNPNSFKFKDLYSNDIMLGLRWTCCDIAPPPPRYVYQPQPYIPPPPPLQSRGYRRVNEHGENLWLSGT